LSRPIIVEGFNGSLKGEGMHSTIIEAVRKGPNPGEGFEMAVLPNGYFLPVLFFFNEPNGDVNIAALTTQCLVPNPADPWGASFGWTAMNNFFDIWHGDFNTSFENVRFRGSSGDWEGYNVAHSIRIIGGDGGLNKGVGNHTIKNTDTDQIFCGPHIDNWKNSTITIGGIEADKNTFTNIGLDAIRTYFIDNSNVLIKENTIMMSNGQIGIRVWYAPGSLVQGNTISGTWAGWIPVGILAYESPMSYIADNQINSDGNYFGIYFYASPNSLVQGNYLTGSLVYYGIYLSWADSTLIKGNSFENFTSEENAVSIEYSQQCIVTENTFTNVTTPRGIVWNSGSNNSILDNDYRKSGVTGWGDPWWTDYGCVMLYFGSNDNLVSESGDFMPGTGGAMSHVFDLGTNNRVVGHPANHVSDPGIGQGLQEIKDEIAAKEQLIAEMLAALEQEPY